MFINFKDYNNKTGLFIFADKTKLGQILHKDLKEYGQKNTEGIKNGLTEFERKQLKGDEDEERPESSVLLKENVAYIEFGELITHLKFSNCGQFLVIATS